MKANIRSVVPVLFAATVAACSEAVPETTDQQILDLFGSRLFVSSDGAPPTIAKNVEECVRLMAGLDKDIYKDMPDILSGEIKTDCRKKFSTLLADAGRNPMGLKLEHLEQPEFAERLTKVRADANTAQRAYYEAEKDRRKAEQRQKQQAIIDGAKTKLAETTAGIEGRLKSIAQLCETWSAELEALKRHNSRTPVYMKPSACYESFAKQARQQLQNAEEAIGKMKVNEEGFSFIGDPYFGSADLKNLDEQIDDLKKRIETMKAA